MGSLWDGIGFFRWPLAICFVMVLVLGLRGFFKLFRPGVAADLRTKAWLDGILPWGFIAFLNGVMGSVVGIILSLQAVERVGAFDSTAMAPGIKSSLLSMFFGAFICAVAVFLWYLLQLRWRLLEADSAEDESWRNAGAGEN